MAEQYDNLAGTEMDAGEHPDNSHKYMIDSNETGSTYNALQGGTTAGETPKQSLARKMGAEAPWYKESVTPKQAHDTMRRQGYRAQDIVDSVKWGN